MDWIETAAVAAAVFLATLTLGAIGVPLLKRLQVGQTVRDDGPSSHKVKTGTPTFGGLFFGLPILAAGLAALLFDPEMWRFSLLAGVILLSGLIGFADDYIKVRINREGLSAKGKTLFMLLLYSAFAVAYLYLVPDPPVLVLPISQRAVAITGLWKPVYGLFLVLYLYFTVNAVNLNDGVDGLCASVTFLVSLCLCACASAVGSTVPAASSVVAASAATAAGCLGFLPYNRHKARVFMGDTGSFILGSSVAGAALLLGMPWLILPAGIIYLAEAFSVIIQVAYFKKTGGKRIFRMSPIHHHYELGGWSEWKIVGVFSAVTLAGGLAAYLLVL